MLFSVQNLDQMLSSQIVNNAIVKGWVTVEARARYTSLCIIVTCNDSCQAIYTVVAIAIHSRVWLRKLRYSTAMCLNHSTQFDIVKGSMAHGGSRETLNFSIKMTYM